MKSLQIIVIPTQYTEMVLWELAEGEDLMSLADRGGKGQTGVLLVSGKLVDNWCNVVYLYVYLNTE